MQHLNIMFFGTVLTVWYFVLSLAILRSISHCC